MIVEVATHLPGAGPPAPGPALLRASRLDPDVRALLRRLNLYPVRPTAGYSLARGRRDWQLAIKAFGSREPVHSVAERHVPGPGGDLRLRIYRPAPGRRPVLVWIHGGGFILGDLYTAGGTCRALANRSGAVVVAVRYRLAPEHPLHAGHEDALAAVRWVAEHAAELGADPARIAVGGDSAGGALAARAAQRCAQEGIALAAQALVYPATDLAGEYPSHAENAAGYMLTSESIEWIRDHMRQVSDLADPELSPMRTEDVAGVAPAVVATAGYDPLRDEGLAYAARLRDAGVPLRTLHYADHVHGFLSFDRVLAGGRDALDRVGAGLASAFDSGGFAPDGDGMHSDRTRAWPNSLSRASVEQRLNEARVTQLVAGEWLGQQAYSAVTFGWRLATGQRPRPRPRPRRSD